MSGSGGEMRGFVFAVIFIIVFSTMLVSVPAGLQGPDETPDTVIPIDPSIISGFAESENYTQSAFYPVAGSYWYEYDALGSRDWVAGTDNATIIQLAAKILFLGIFWFGQIDSCEFTTQDGEDRGIQLSFSEIDADSTDGAVRYSLDLTTSGDSGGSFVAYWNTTAHANSVDAWLADELYLIHGVGIAETATANIGALIVSLLFLQLPDVPVLINAFIAVPVWACVLFVLWFIIKEMIPFS